jgi:RNA polymerase sigma factor (sigma-70 family)
MAQTQLTFVLQHLRGPTGGTASDRELLDRFCACRDEAAFTQLLRRQGPMVLGVGRRLLRPEEAEDVFQATFLLLARKASTIRQRESVGSWLHGVAHHLALKTRACEARRKAHEQRAGQMPRPAATAETAWRELQEVLDEVLQGLPEHHRTVLVLCYLEGQTQEEAARQLGCPLGTVRSRLARGRKALHDALTRRGLTLSMAALVTALVAHGARAGVPARLLGPLPRLAAHFAAGGEAAGLVSPRAASLADAGLKTTCASKAKVLVALLLVAGLAAGVAGALPRPGAGAGQAEAPPEAKQPERVAERKEPRTDRFGDPLPEGAVARLGTLRLYHGLNLRRVVLSPDGKLVSGTDDSFRNRLWEAGSGRELELKDTLKTAFIFTARGRLLAAERVPGGYRLTDLVTGKEVEAGGIDVKAARKSAENIGQGEYRSPDGRVIVVLKDKSLALLDAATLEELPPLEGVPAEGALSATFSPDSRVLAVPYVLSVRFPEVWLWDLSTRKVVRKLKAKDYQVFHTAFSADGRLLAAADGYGVTLWDTKTGNRVHDFGHTYLVGSLAFTSDGQTLLTGAAYNDGVIRVWDPLTGKQRDQWRGHDQGGILGLVVTPDGQFAIDNSLRVWEVATGKEVRRLGDGKEGAWTIALSPDGKVLASSPGKVIRLWDVATGKELHTFGSGSILRVRFSPDGKTLATAGSKDRVVRLWDVADGKELRTLEGHEATHPCLAFSPDGRFLATGDTGGTIRLWDPTTGQELRQIDGPRKPGPQSAESLWSIAFSPDGHTLAAGYSDRTVRLWEVASGGERGVFADGHRSGIVGLAFSPDGHLLASGSWDRTAVVWDVTGQRTAQRMRPADLTPEKLNALWTDLADTNAAKAYRAEQALFTAGGRAVQLLKGRLRPEAGVDARMVERLVGDLDSDEFEVREKAARELVALGEGVEPALRKLVASKPSLEARRRAEEVLRGVDPGRLPELLRSLRAVEVLEQVGGDEAKQVLAELAKGAPEARLTREAKAALERLNRRAAP